MEVYGCSNKDRATKDTEYKVMSRQYWGKRYAKLEISIPYSFTTDCQYDKSATDVKCCDCKWKKI